LAGQIVLQGKLMRAPVSVIIPCYRCADTVQRAIESVIAQTLPPAEMLLIEDCSDDQGNTLAVLFSLQEKYCDSIDIKVIPLPTNGGPGVARNAGWDEAKQPYVAFLDADDSWHPKKIEIQYAWMSAHPEVDLTGHQSKLISPDEIILELPEQFPVSHVRPLKFLLSNSLPMRSVMLRRETILQRFSPDKRRAEDYLLWLTVIFSGHQVFRIELPLSYSYKSDFGVSGLTADLWKMEKGELDTYKRIHADGHISGALYLFVQGFSLAKYMRRLLMIRFRLGI
jgi:glycosyltransferase involved in cell wall biosynthesis